MSDHRTRSARFRYTATGAFAALVAAGAIAGPSVLAATPHAKAGASQPASSQPFLAAVQRLVNDGTISAAQGQAVDRQILSPRINLHALTSSGMTQAQIQAVVQALGNTKRALAADGTSTPAAAGASKPAPGPDAAAPAAGKAGQAPQAANNPFLLAVQRLVREGAITRTEGEIVDRQILAGSLDSQTLTSSGFTQAQVQAVVQALGNTKRALR